MDRLIKKDGEADEECAQRSEELKKELDEITSRLARVKAWENARTAKSENEATKEQAQKDLELASARFESEEKKIPEREELGKKIGEIEALPSG